MCVLRFLITVSFILMTHYSGAQATAPPDYIITFKGDTIRGIVAISYDMDKVQITPPDLQGKKMGFRAFQIRAIRQQGEVYNPLPYGTSYRFMKLIKSGYLSLYAFRDPNQSAFDGRFLVKRDGSSVEVPNFMFKKVISGFLKDCEKVAREIREGTIKITQLEQIVDEYNVCIDNNTRRIYATVPDRAPNPKSILLVNLEVKVQGLPDFPHKKDAMDLLHDIGEKLDNHQPVPNYLTEGLENYLGTIDPVRDDLKKLMETLKN
jgi:hypothetical protein